MRRILDEFKDGGLALPDEGGRDPAGFPKMQVAAAGYHEDVRRHESRDHEDRASDQAHWEARPDFPEYGYADNHFPGGILVYHEERDPGQASLEARVDVPEYWYADDDQGPGRILMNHEDLVPGHSYAPPSGEVAQQYVIIIPDNGASSLQGAMSTYAGEVGPAGYGEPIPALYDAPAGYPAPVPVYDGPAGYPAPVPVFYDGSAGYPAPVPVYDGPAGYPAPVPVFYDGSAGYPAPVPVYDGPAGYPAPVPVYDGPAGYPAPVPVFYDGSAGYPAPVPVFYDGSAGYPAPVPVYDGPAGYPGPMSVISSASASINPGPYGYVSGGGYEGVPGGSSYFLQDQAPFAYDGGAMPVAGCWGDIALQTAVHCFEPGGPDLSLPFPGWEAGDWQGHHFPAPNITINVIAPTPELMHMLGKLGMRFDDGNAEGEYSYRQERGGAHVFGEREYREHKEGRGDKDHKVKVQDRKDGEKDHKDHKVKVKDLKDDEKDHKDHKVKVQDRKDGEKDHKDHKVKVKDLKDDEKDHKDHKVKAKDLKGDKKDHKDHKVKAKDLKGDKKDHKDHKVKVKDLKDDEKDHKDHKVKVNDLKDDEKDHKDHKVKVKDLKDDEKDHKVKDKDCNGGEKDHKDHKPKVNEYKDEGKDHKDHDVSGHSPIVVNSVPKAAPEVEKIRDINNNHNVVLGIKDLKGFDSFLLSNKSIDLVKSETPPPTLDDLQDELKLKSSSITSSTKTTSAEQQISHVDSIDLVKSETLLPPLNSDGELPVTITEKSEINLGFSGVPAVHEDVISTLSDVANMEIPSENETDYGTDLMTDSQVEEAKGTDDVDFIVGTSGPDHLVLLKGNDVGNGVLGDDVIEGGEGADKLEGGPGEDTLNGDQGDDVLSGGAGEDTLNGDQGDDVLSGGSGDDVLNGGVGNDVADYGKLDFDVRVDLSAYKAWGDGTDTLNSIEYATGGAGSDHLYGDSFGNVLLGGAGDDTIEGRGGDDSLQGGEGRDNLEGGAESDALFGGAGDDLLKGGDGNDVLVGGAGSDVLVGGEGADLFKLGAHSSVPGAMDTIVDFEKGDHIRIDTAVKPEGGFSMFDELKISHTGDYTSVTYDDFAVKLSGNVQLSATDFVFFVDPNA